MPDNKINIQIVVHYLKTLQKELCQQFENFEPQNQFSHDQWDYPHGRGGITRVLEQGSVLERAGVNFSHVVGEKLPVAASATRPQIAGLPFQATGVSVVVHPLNPMAPTCHMNVRFFMAGHEDSEQHWWFGGGYDLTPYYGFTEDCIHWHRQARQTCDHYCVSYYPRFKQQCDDYFYLKHRAEQRGIGGLFFDDFNELGFDGSFAFIKDIANSFIKAYEPILSKRKDIPYSQEQRTFQLHRRGRYVEFNLLYDRGTLFGLQSNGRTESILMSMPPKVNWSYQFEPRTGSAEENLLNYFLVPRDWLGMQI